MQQGRETVKHLQSFHSGQSAAKSLFQTQWKMGSYNNTSHTMKVREQFGQRIPATVTFKKPICLKDYTVFP